MKKSEQIFQAIAAACPQSAEAHVSYLSPDCMSCTPARIAMAKELMLLVAGSPICALIKREIARMEKAQSHCITQSGSLRAALVRLHRSGLYHSSTRERVYHEIAVSHFPSFTDIDTRQSHINSLIGA